MPNFCAVYKCSSRADRERGLSFFRIPAIIKHQGEKTHELSSLRRKEWLEAIRRDDLDEEKCARSRPVVCSKHFYSGKPSQLYDKDNPDWSPSLLLGYGNETGSTMAVDRYNRRKARLRMLRSFSEQLPEQILPNQSLQTTNFKFILPSNDEIETETFGVEAQIVDSGRVSESVTQTDMKMIDLDALQRELLNSTEIIVNLKQQLSLKDPFSKESFQDNNQKVKYYSGLPNYEAMIILFQLVEPNLLGNGSLSKFHQFVLTCMKLRLNLQQLDLSYRFGISSSTVSRIFNSCINLLYVKLSNLVQWTAEELHEQVIGVVRQKYAILQGTLASDTFNVKGDTDDLAPIDKIAFICCAMTNLTPDSIVPISD